MKKIVLVFLLIHCLFLNGIAQKGKSGKKDSIPQISRGSLLFNDYPKVLDSFITNGFINLNYVRTTCHFLTDNDIVKYKSYYIPRRNKAFIRHIKHINEQLEEYFQDNKPVNNEMMELFFELSMFSESLKQKAIVNANPKILFRQKIGMKLNSIRSGRAFRYQNKTTKDEAKNVDPRQLEQDPEDSPFWHDQVEGISLDKRFSQLAKLKKIKAKKEMVVIFDKPSLSGSAPKVNVLDLDLDNKWSLKWGDEVHTDVVGSHIFAALGYDVDHPYYYGEDKLTLIFDGLHEIKNVEELKTNLKKIYKLDISPFISTSGFVTLEMADSCTDLIPFIGKQYARFKKCAVEARPDRVKRIGSFVPDKLSNEERRELRGALLANQFIGNWDTKESNTLLTTIHRGNYDYRMSAVFSDLGTSFGVVQNTLPPDLKVGLVNEFKWEVAIKKRRTVRLNTKINSILKCYDNATYQDIMWMAKKIAAIDSQMLWSMVKKAHWPDPIAELYFHKLASRRASILQAFNLNDPHPIPFDRHLNRIIDGKDVIKDGQLIVDFERNKNPESFLSKKGRFRNYGN